MSAATGAVPRPVDPNRLRRAVSRSVRRIGPSRFLVEGKHEPEYLVDLDEGAPCTCVDAQRTGGPCLHELAARLAFGDGELVPILGRLLSEAEREARTMRVRARRPNEGRR